MTWTTKNDDDIELRDMSDNHLMNAIKFVQKKSVEGMTMTAGGGFDSYDIWFDEWTIKGREVKNHFKYHSLLREARRRNLMPKLVKTGINLSLLKESDRGRWVVYKKNSKLSGESEEGRIKSWNKVFIFVVYKCNGEWDRYQDFTGQATKPEDLTFLDKGGEL